MVTEKDEKVEEIKPVKPVKKITLTKEQLESRRRAHDLKVQKFLSGGSY